MHMIYRIEFAKSNISHNITAKSLFTKQRLSDTFVLKNQNIISMFHKLIITTAAALSLTGCGQRQQPAPVPLVRIDTVKTVIDCDMFEFPGHVKAAEEVNLCLLYTSDAADD